MYRINVFEKAINICGYNLEKAIFSRKTSEKRLVKKVIGVVSIPQKISVNGLVKTVLRHKRLRWDCYGRAYSLRSSVRQRNYDLPLRSVIENGL